MKRYRSQNKLKIKYKNYQIIILLLILLACTSFVLTMARYTINDVKDFYFRTKEFYFYSDKLKENLTHYQIENWSGIDDYVITINLNNKKNNLVSTNYDIPYRISYQCSSNSICQLSKTSGNVSSSTGADYFNLTVTPNAQLRTGDTVWVRITAESIGEYKKTLMADFSLIVGQEQLSYEIIDNVNSKYLDFKITNTLTYYNVDEAFSTYSVGDRIEEDAYLALSQTDKYKCHSALITLRFNPNEVLLDMTNPNYLNAINVVTQVYSGYNYINEITFKMDAISSANVRFYKTNTTENYTYPIINSNSIITFISQ